MDEDSSSLAAKVSVLLKPIRELAANWDVDIACELEDYLTKLSSINLSDNGAQINFAEAALLIQGSASIYSKKVEYLYNLLFRTLEQVSQQEAQNAARKASSIREDGKDEDVFEEDPLEFLALDDVVENSMGTNIDLEEDWEAQALDKTKSTTSISQQKAALRFAFSLGNSSSGSLPASQTTSMDIPSVDNPRINGSDFRMNSSFLSSSGALMLGSSMDLLSGSMGIGSLSFSSLSSLNLLSPSRQNSNPTSMALADEDVVRFLPDGSAAPQGAGLPVSSHQVDFVGGGAMDGNDSDDEHDFPEVRWDALPSAGSGILDENGELLRGASVSELAQEDGAQEANEDGEDDEKARQKLDRTDRQLLRSLVDPWLMHDPHDPGTVAAKPFKRGRPYKIPKKKKKTNKKEDDITPPVDEAPADEHVAGVALLDLNIALNKPFLPEFTYILDQENKKKQTERLKLRREAILSEAAKGGVFVEESHLKKLTEATTEEEGINNGTAGDTGDDSTVVSFAHYSNGLSSSSATTAFENGQNNWNGIGGGAADGGPDSDSDDGYDNTFVDWSDTGRGAPITTELTYEEHCKLRLEEYFQSAQQWVQETELSARIDEWSKRLAPMLQEQEARPNFDIHDYGTRLISKVQEVGAPSKESKVDDGGSPPPLSVANFADLFHGLPSYEVSRSFSSMLQLANMGNIVIVPSRLQPGGLHDITLHLISTEPRVDIDSIARTQASHDDILATESLPTSTKNNTKSGAKKAGAKRGSKAAR